MAAFQVLLTPCRRMTDRRVRTGSLFTEVFRWPALLSAFRRVHDSADACIKTVFIKPWGIFDTAKLRTHAFECPALVPKSRICCRFRKHSLALEFDHTLFFSLAVFSCAL